MLSGGGFQDGGAGMEPAIAAARPPTTANSSGNSRRAFGTLGSMEMTVTSYIDSLVSVLRGAPDRTVLRSAGTGTTGAELLAATYRYARVLGAQGVGPGDLVALLASAGPSTSVSPASARSRCRTRCAGSSSVRYAVLVADPGQGWIAAAEAWPGGAVDAEPCRAAVAEDHGPEVAASLRLMPVDQIPLTEQGKPNRPAIRAAGEAVTRW